MKVYGPSRTHSLEDMLHSQFGKETAITWGILKPLHKLHYSPEEKRLWEKSVEGRDRFYEMGALPTGQKDCLLPLINGLGGVGLELDHTMKVPEKECMLKVQ